MKNLLISSALALTLSACVVAGHPSTDRNHSHVDQSATRYDDYQRHYDKYDQTGYRHNYRKPQPDENDYDDHDAYERDYNNWERNR